MPSSPLNNDKHPVISKCTKCVPFRFVGLWRATGESGVSAPVKTSGDSPHIPNVKF